ncbi:MAG: hypothetical protein Q9181_006887 [Wetmoreana brouardii]
MMDSIGGFKSDGRTKVQQSNCGESVGGYSTPMAIPCQTFGGDHCNFEALDENGFCQGCRRKEDDGSFPTMTAIPAFEAQSRCDAEHLFFPIQLQITIKLPGMPAKITVDYNPDLKIQRGDGPAEEVGQTVSTWQEPLNEPPGESSNVPAVPAKTILPGDGPAEKVGQTVLTWQEPVHEPPGDTSNVPAVPAKARNYRSSEGTILPGYGPAKTRAGIISDWKESDRNLALASTIPGDLYMKAICGEPADDDSANTHVPDKTVSQQALEPSDGASSASQSLFSAIPEPRVPTRTAILLLSAAKMNWNHVCEVLMEPATKTDRQILHQIQRLVGKLGTGTMPTVPCQCRGTEEDVQQANSRSDFESFREEEIYKDEYAHPSNLQEVPHNLLCSVTEEDAEGGSEAKSAGKEAADEAAHQPSQPKNENDNPQIATEKVQELAVLRERITSSLWMRRKEQPIEADPGFHSPQQDPSGNQGSTHGAGLDAEDDSALIQLGHYGKGGGVGDSKTLPKTKDKCMTKNKPNSERALGVALRPWEAEQAEETRRQSDRLEGSGDNIEEPGFGQSRGAEDTEQQTTTDDEWESASSLSSDQDEAEIVKEEEGSKDNEKWGGDRAADLEPSQRSDESEVSYATVLSHEAESS